MKTTGNYWLDRIKRDEIFVPCKASDMDYKYYYCPYVPLLVKDFSKGKNGN